MMTERDLREQLAAAAAIITDQRSWITFLMTERCALLGLVERYGDDELLTAARRQLETLSARLPAALVGAVVH
jgi:hypothetical protein